MAIIIRQGNFEYTSTPIASSVFGDEFLGHGGTLFGYAARHEVIGAHHLRWPGSVSVEDGYFISGDQRSQVFDISTENIFNWYRSTGQREGLSEVMQSAVANGQSLAVTIPTSNYVAKLFAEVGVSTICNAVLDGDRAAIGRVLASSAVAELRSEVKVFIDRLLTGAFGPVPDQFTIEVGTEYYSTNVWGALVGNRPAGDIVFAQEVQATIARNGGLLSGTEAAAAFGAVFALVADEIGQSQQNATADGRNTENVDVQVAVQLGALQRGYAYESSQGSAGNNEVFVAAFHNFGSFGQVDSLIWHRYVGSFELADQTTFAGESADGEHTTYSLSDMIEVWQKGRSDGDLELIAGWLAPGNQADPGQYGARSLNSILQMFTMLVEQGVDIASIYGTDGFGDDGQLGALGQGRYTYIGGRLYGLMAEVLPGAHALNLAELDSNQSFVDVRPGTLADTPRNTDYVNTFSYENNSQAFIFLTSGDFGSSGDGIEQLTVTLQVEGHFTSAWSTHLFDPGWSDSHSGTFSTTGEFETSIDRSISYTFSYANGFTTVNVTFLEEFEVIRLILTRAMPDSDPDLSNALFQRGTQWSETILGRSGDDHLWGDGGNDLMIGGAGNDIIDGGTGVDTYSGGLGDDTYYLDANDSMAISDPGSDTVITVGQAFQLSNASQIENLVYIGLAGRDLLGNASDNYIQGGQSNDTLFGGAGDDSLNGGAGQDVFLGGLGDDTYEIGQNRELIIERFNEGIDIIRYSAPSGTAMTYQLQANIENIFAVGTRAISVLGNDLANMLRGTNQNDTISGGQGDDTLIGMAGHDTLYGGSGDDQYTLGDGDTCVESSGAGHDVIETQLLLVHIPEYIEDLVFKGGGNFIGVGNAIGNTIAGSFGSDKLFGNGGSDRLQGDAGNDILNGGAGADLLIGGTGDDTYYVDSTLDHLIETVNGGKDRVVTTLSTYALLPNVEVLSFSLATTQISSSAGFKGLGNSSNNIIIGTTGSDSFDGAAGSDLLYGGAGNDILAGGRGADTLIGGVGNDTYVVDSVNDVVVELTNAGQDTIQTTLSSFVLLDTVESLQFIGVADFSGVGSDFNNIIWGGAGSDRLFGRGGNDLLFGGTGNDYLGGGAGADVLVGGAGSDLYFVDNSSDIVREAIGGGIDTVMTILQTFQISENVENLCFQGNFQFEGTGNGLDNQISGGGNRDTLYSMDGSDTIFGGGGDDYLNGGNGDDRINGGLGNDFLFGGIGANLLIGGAGNDTYVLGSQQDRILDWSDQGFDRVFVSSNFVLMRGSSIERIKTAIATGTAAISISGNEKNQEMYGNAGGNRLDGGGGIDVLIGGLGADIFRFSSQLSSTNCATIHDFNSAADTIELSDTIFGNLGRGFLSESEFLVNLSGLPSSYSSQIIYESDSGILWYDQDGVGGFDRSKFAMLVPGLMLTAQDFLIS